MYLAWSDGDPTWKNVRTRRTSGTPRVGRAALTKTTDTDVNASDPDQGSVLLQSLHRRTMSAPTVTYQLPLRPDLLIQIQLPVDLTQTDADRVAAFVRSLAFDRPMPASRSDDEADEGV